MSEPSVRDAKTEAELQRQALVEFQQNPVAFIQREIDQAIKAHLLVANEDGQARVAMQGFLRQNPDAEPVMNYILEEVARLIESDTDGVLAPWPDLFQEALSNFVTKFQGNVKESTVSVPNKAPEMPFIEQGKLPSKAPAARVFTRSEIGKMSPQEYLANEAVIRQAFKENRIQ